MNWKVEAGIPADYWFLRTLNWVRSVTIEQEIPLAQPAVIRVEFDVFPHKVLTREEAQAALQGLLDTAGLYYIYILYACYDPARETLMVEIDLPRHEIPYEAVYDVGGLAIEYFDMIYWTNTCDFAWLDYFEQTAILADYRVPIAQITEEMHPRLLPVIFLGLGMFTIAVLAAKPWREGDWRK